MARNLRRQGGTIRVLAGAGGAKRELWLKPGESFQDLAAGPELVAIPPGSFTMGSRQGGGSEWPQHEVAIPHAFAAGKYPVTFREWDAALAAGAGLHGADNWGERRGRQPVFNVAWLDAKAYVQIS